MFDVFKVGRQKRGVVEEQRYMQLSPLAKVGQRMKILAL